VAWVVEVGGVLELLEISVPADMGTVARDRPDGWSKRA
jgi:hypothetical protein